jgi:hypothetical protein
MHDSGWPLHDEQPTLNDQRIPRDVFETTREIGLRVWEQSADRATARDDYAGLLVSLHGLALSVFATEHSPLASKLWDLNQPRARFELNRFQHRMVELQESLRQRLGMHTDRPLRHGLNETSTDAKEQRLTFDFRWLQAMDRMSLAICCTNPPFQTMEPLHPAPGAAPISVAMRRNGVDVLIIDPWLFCVDRIPIHVPHRPLPARPYVDEAEYRAAYAAAPVEQFTVTIQPNTMQP